MIPFSGNKM